jgi:hypothetical protein
MRKKGDVIKNWKTRYFVFLSNNELRYYVSETELSTQKCKGSIDMNSATGVRNCQAKKFKHTFEIVTPSRTYVLSCASQSEADDWILFLSGILRKS